MISAAWTRVSLIAVVAILLLTVTVTNWPQNGRTVNEGLLKQCSVSWPPWTSTQTANTTRRESPPSIGVLLVSPGTTSKLCVGYGSNSNYAVNLQLNPSVVDLSLSTAGVEVTAEPSVLTVLSDNNGLSPTGVAYAVFTLKASNDSKGFYVLEFPGCLQPLASGYSASQVNASDFGGWVQQVQRDQCAGNAQVNLSFVSESNLNITVPVVTS
jgi:hypothetical protein